MYLRKSKKKNGRVYLTIVEGYRDDRGKNMSRTVESLGYVDDLRRSGIADPVAHFAEECARENEAKWIGNPYLDSFFRDRDPHSRTQPDSRSLASSAA